MVVLTMKKLATLAALAATASVSFAADPTNIDGVVSTLETYRTAAVGVGVAILLFMLGRTIVRKIAK